MQLRPPRLVSVVAPVHNNAAQLPGFVDEVASALKNQKVEIILVDDGSRDDSWAIVLQEKAQRRSRITVRGIKLSRNFGQHRAICAGLQAARGDFVFVLDADLQDDPAFMPGMLSLGMAGFPVVHARRRVAFFDLRNLVSRLVYLVVTKASEIPLHPGMGNYKLLNRKALQATLQFQTYEPLFELMVARAGFRPGFVDVVRRNRPATSSAYSICASLGFVFGLLVNYSTLFFRAMLLGGILAIAVVPCVLWLLYGSQHFLLVFSVLASLLVGLLLLAAGLLGYYIRNLQMHSRNWPIYIIEETA